MNALPFHQFHPARVRARRICCTLLLVGLASPLLAEVTLPGCLSDHMVLQQQSQVKIWGWADPDEAITVAPGWSAMPTVTRADPDGRWQAWLTTPVAGGPYTLSVRAGNERVLEDILIGEVWLCSGQSNMQWELRQARDHQTEVPAAEYPRIRLLTIPRTADSAPQEDCDTRWELCSPETAARFSAVGYFFGRELREKLDVPIGLISSAYGGTPAEAWTRAEAIADHPGLRPIYDADQDYLASRPRLEADYQKLVDQWEVDRTTQPDLPKPRYPNPLRLQHRSGYLFNGMLAPLLNYRIQGAIWYQGETNEPRAYQYAELFQTLIRNWRAEWGYRFPFYFVQIAPYPYGKPEATTCPELQESQAAALALPATGMAVIWDVGNLRDIHPRNKQVVGRRLANLALANTYGFRGITCEGPTYRDVTWSDGLAVIRFDHAANGLRADGDLRAFEMAGIDRVFHPAQAILRDQTVSVICGAVEHPVAVRFAWRNQVEPNLFNAEGLPAVPFRTDAWPGSTYDARRP